MYKLILFGGTTEGRELAEYLTLHRIPALVCVASDYGGSIVKAGGATDVLVGRLDDKEMKSLLEDKCPEYVIDATHPYAFIASRNISAACEALNIKYLRVGRRKSNFEGSFSFDSMEELIDELDKTEGGVFLSTGSKDVKSFRRLNNYRDRIYARVLPSAESIELCFEAGILASHIICMQGPFSYELNLAMFKETEAKILVTKDSGENGGFHEKISAAQRLGMRVFLLNRPSNGDEIYLEDVKKIIGRIDL